MRTGEVFALIWDDIDLDNRIIKINKKKNKVIGHKKIKTTQKYCINNKKEDKEKVGRVFEKSLKN